MEVSQGAKGNDGKTYSKGSKLGASCVYRVAGGLEWRTSVVLGKGSKKVDKRVQVSQGNEQG